MDDLLLFTPNENTSFCQIGRFAEGTTQKWIEDFPKEVPTFQN